LTSWALFIVSAAPLLAAPPGVAPTRFVPFGLGIGIERSARRLLHPRPIGKAAALPDAQERTCKSPC